MRYQLLEMERINRNIGLLLFGIGLLLMGIAVYLYPDNRGWFQALGLILIVVGIVFAALGFFYPSKRTPSPPSAQEKERTQGHQAQTVHPPPPPYAPPSMAGGNAAVRLEKFKELLDKNLISKEDYEKKKAEILSQV